MSSEIPVWARVVDKFGTPVDKYSLKPTTIIKPGKSYLEWVEAPSWDTLSAGHMVLVQEVVAGD